MSNRQFLKEEKKVEIKREEDSIRITPEAPQHYRDYVDDSQWIDIMSKIPTLRDPVKFEAALELQIRKYLDRLNQKDNSIQELKKARFYLCYLIEYKRNDNKILPATLLNKFLEKFDENATNHYREIFYRGLEDSREKED